MTDDVEPFDDQRCDRCGGLLHPAKYWDLSESPSHGVYLFTCINCGNVVDSQIQRNRTVDASTFIPPKMANRARARLAHHKSGRRKGSQNMALPPLRMGRL